MTVEMSHADVGPGFIGASMRNPYINSITDLRVNLSKCDSHSMSDVSMSSVCVSIYVPVDCSFDSVIVIVLTVISKLCEVALNRMAQINSIIN